MRNVLEPAELTLGHLERERSIYNRLPRVKTDPNCPVCKGAGVFTRNLGTGPYKQNCSHCQPRNEPHIRKVPISLFKKLLSASIWAVRQGYSYKNDPERL